jgi:phosphatidylserine/phosphatidylglycerophosphate/cardiolipin synthase-like enzyme
MKRVMIAVMIIGLVTGIAIAGTPMAYFSPKGGCEKIICDAISHSKTTVVVSAYVYCNKAIVAEAIKAHKRGVVVSIIVDPEQVTASNSQSVVSFTNGVNIWVDPKHAIFHNKYIIIDHKKVITGSFNYSFNAENRNAENILVIQDKKLAAQYEQDWEKHRSHSVLFNGYNAIPREAANTEPSDDGEHPEQ